MALRISARCPSFGYLSWARKKGDKSGVAVQGKLPVFLHIPVAGFG